MSNSGTNSGSSLFVKGITIVATLGGLLFGFDSGVINGTVDGLQSAFNSDSVATGFNVASMLLGCAVGAFFAGRLADIFGRRAILRISAVFFIISAWGSGVADASLPFIFYRIIGGLAVGAASVMAPAYISEVSPANVRGSLATIQQVAIISGLFIAFISNYAIAGIAGSATSTFLLGFDAWRWMFWVELIPATIFLGALFLIPESPRYYVVAGDDDLALDVLNRLYGEEEAKKKLKDIKESLAKDKHKPKFSDLWDKATQKVKPIVWVGIGLATFQQLVGINVVFYYGAVLWQSVGFSESNSLLINVINGGVSVAAVLAAMAVIDKVGRKPLLWIGSVGMAISLGAMSIAFSTATLGDNGLSMSDTWGAVALVAANVYVAFFNGSWGPVMWVMLGEMFPNQIRGSGLAVSGLAQWLSNFGITMTFPILLASIGLTGAYGIYGVCAFISIFFVLKLVPETKGRELEEMDDLWEVAEQASQDSVT